MRIWMLLWAAAVSLVLAIPALADDGLGLDFDGMGPESTPASTADVVESEPLPQAVEPEAADVVDSFASDSDVGAATPAIAVDPAAPVIPAHTPPPDPAANGEAGMAATGGAVDVETASDVVYETDAEIADAEMAEQQIDAEIAADTAARGL